MSWSETARYVRQYGGYRSRKKGNNTSVYCLVRASKIKQLTDISGKYLKEMKTENDTVIQYHNSIIHGVLQQYESERAHTGGLYITGEE